MKIVQDGILHRAGLFREERCLRFDDVERVEGEAVITAGGERLVVGAEIARATAAIVAGPSLDGSLAEMGRSAAAAFRAPHGPQRLARRLIEIAEALGATDLHCEPAPDTTILRVRLEGELALLCEIPAGAGRRLAAALKGLAGCLPYRGDIVQEGRIARAGERADIRASFVPAAFGDRVALRLFGRIRRLDELGLEPGTLASVRKALDLPSGLVVVAGPTGAGKTTTLYAALAHLAATRAGAHLSLEDPIEQRLRAAGIAVDQVELDPERGRTGEAMLVAALRQDVDVLAVGEVRTPAEARLAVQASHTGRLVLAGVHAGSPAEARARLIDLGADETMLARALRAVLHQSLVVEACGCGGAADCKRCRGVGRVRRLVATLDAPAARLEAVA